MGVSERLNCRLDSGEALWSDGEREREREGASLMMLFSPAVGITPALYISVMFLIQPGAYLDSQINSVCMYMCACVCVCAYIHLSGQFNTVL